MLGQFLANFGHFWPILAISGQLWPFLANFGHFWPLLTIFLATFGQTLATLATFWPLLAILTIFATAGVSIAGLHNLSGGPLLVIFGLFLALLATFGLINQKFCIQGKILLNRIKHLLTRIRNMRPNSIPPKL
eukprot:EG_transcript_18696